jgi:LDH2 family malate/lactate/ureidoglycolate dehydrogenase
MTDGRYHHDELINFASLVYQRYGVPKGDADILANSLVQADLWGHQSHGLLRLSWYAERLKAGTMTPETKISHVSDFGAIGVIDANDGIGQVVTTIAMNDAIARAKRYGIGAVAVRNSNHFGTCMYYTRKAAEQNCIGFLTTNGGPAMAPWGGIKKTIGTNPWSYASPAGKYAPMILDIANTAVARGKIYLAKNRREQIPLGWALNSKGEPTTDPQEAIDGIILPMAGHKGYAISAIMDVLSGVLSGSCWGEKVNGPYKYDRKSGAGHFMLALNIESFRTITDFNQEIEQMIESIKATPKAPGIEQIYYPGELEALNDRHNRAQGINYSEKTVNDLEKTAKELNLESDLPLRKRPNG